MKELDKETILDFEVEDFANYIYEKKIAIPSLKSKIHNFSLSKENQDKVLKRIKFSEQRLNKPLSTSEKILLLFFPFGIVNRLYKNDFFNIKEEFDLGYKKRVNQFFRYSVISMLAYIILVLIYVFVIE
tara:strand:- start:54638 stop:55024 length:387 start_codon:yes stop_codon:yes gene_type:complete